MIEYFQNNPAEERRFNFILQSSVKKKVLVFPITFTAAKKDLHLKGFFTDSFMNVHFISVLMIFSFEAGLTLLIAILFGQHVLFITSKK
jgi:hypothetical protein